MKDKIMNSKLLKKIASWRISKALSTHPFFSKIFNYEMISYLIAGVLTTIVNYVVFFVMPRFESNGLDVLLANTVAWILAVIFAFIVNKIFVFDSPSWNKKIIFKEAIPFFVCRLLSLLFDNLFVFVTIGLLNLNEPLFKLLSNVFVLLANYFASKFIIFKKKDVKE